MELKGLKANFLGDSITEGVGASSIENVYWKVLARETGLIANGYGIGGTRIARQKNASANKSWDLDFCMRAEQMDKEADIICVFGGTNDYGHGDAIIGSADDFDVYTFYGALNTLYTYLIQTYPKAFIFVMTPLHRANENRNTGDGYKIPKLSLKGYVDIIREVAEKYSIPVLDLYSNSGIYPDNEINKNMWTVDGLHPNDAGYRKIAGIVKKFLENSYYEKN